MVRVYHTHRLGQAPRSSFFCFFLAHGLLGQFSCQNCFGTLFARANTMPNITFWFWYDICLAECRKSFDSNDLRFSRRPPIDVSPLFSSTYGSAGRPAPLKGEVLPRWGGCTLVQVNMCSVKVLQASDLIFVKRLRLTTGQQHSDAVNVLLRAKLANHCSITSLAIVEKADSWVFHFFLSF